VSKLGDEDKNLAGYDAVLTGNTGVLIIP